MAILGDLFFHAAGVGPVAAHHGYTAKMLWNRRAVTSAADAAGAPVSVDE